ncbi:RDD family protein [Metabacillus litoralis]|uniref:RDD family protein n=1 Tax=Metabacillus litoralis TaxID=152268 RepID=A0A5C6VY42_9BACI|nr:RDD family protein [Metabacillus litoralis]TXC90222.1 RDD family protein [Metabacillus litoralis]
MDATFEGSEKEEAYYSSETVNKSTVLDYSHLLAGFWIRFWAYLVDLLVIGSVNRIVIYPLFELLDISTKKTFIFSPIAITTAITFFAYFVLLTKFKNQTLGKMIFGLKVVSLKEERITWGTIIFRELIGRYISKLIWVGYIIVAFTPKKQGLHDLFADTQVIHEKLYKQESLTKTVS